MRIASKPYRISQIFFWSVISAAFIGPGTITTALKAGASYQLDLIWAIVFSIIACIVLQEAASRLTIISGMTLGEIIQKKYGRKRIFNINTILTFAVIFGCIAYQAGNITGASRGLQLLFDLPKEVILMSLFIIAGAIMWSGKLSRITNILSGLVIIMAVLFIILAFHSDHAFHAILGSIIKPSIPTGSSLVVIGLIGTTIVPYNLFLGSGLSKNKDLRSTRFGLITAISTGGLITVFILITGTLIQGEFNFISVAKTFDAGMGSWAKLVFAGGLFAAGFTSSITAPLAAAITSKTLFKEEAHNSKKTYRKTWITVLSIGFLFSFIDYNPIYIIIIAQAMNGLILPFIAISLLLLLHDKEVVPVHDQYGIFYNLLLLAVVGTTIFLGVFHVINLIIDQFKLNFTTYGSIVFSLSMTMLLLAVIIITILRRRMKNIHESE
jgi:Mn2+/Fe2+ NRAMP family transporter